MRKLWVNLREIKLSIARLSVASLILFILMLSNNFAYGADWCSVSSVKARALIDTNFYSKVKDRSPNPMPEVHSEGTLPHQGIRDESIKARQDMPIMLKAALSWRATGDNKWLQIAQNYLLSWFSIYKLSFNPIDEDRLLPMVSSFVIIQDTLPLEQQRKIRGILHRWASGYIVRMKEGGHSNWQSHRLSIAVAIAVALNDREMFSSLRSLFRRQIEKNINSDGVTYDFRARHAVHYAVYDLVPLVRAALAARTMGEDWYFWRAPNGASLNKAVDWVIPYAKGTKNHKEFPNAKGFDAARAKAGVKDFSGNFEPKQASTLMWLSSQFNPQLASIASELSSTPPFYLKMCGQ